VATADTVVGLGAVGGPRADPGRERQAVTV